MYHIITKIVGTYRQVLEVTALQVVLRGRQGRSIGVTSPPPQPRMQYLLTPKHKKIVFNICKN